MEWVHCHIARKPVPPVERVKAMPAPLSAIVMKLLAKNAEERYQTAAGLEKDLERCLAEWETQGRISEFALATRHAGPAADPRKIVRAGDEIETLLAAFDRVVRPARRSWCSFPAIPASANPPWSTSFTRRWYRRAGFSRRASSTSTSATSLTRPWRRPFRASFVRFSARARPRWTLAPGAPGGTGTKRPTHCGPGPGPEAHHRRAATGPGTCPAQAKVASNSCSGGFSACSRGRNIRWRCFSTICNGSMPQRSISSRIC